MKQREAQPHKLEHLLILGLCTLCIVGAFLLQGSSGEGRLSLPLPFIRADVPLPEACWSRRFLGISCPGCGLTRSFVAMAHGRFIQALELNLMGPFLYVLCWVQIPYRLIEFTGIWSGSRVWNRVNNYSGVLIWVISGGLVAGWLWKLF